MTKENSKTSTKRDIIPAKSSRKQLMIRCYISFFACLAVMLAAALPKIIFLDKSAGTTPMKIICVCAFFVMVLFAVFQYIYYSGDKLDLSVKVLAAICTIMCFCFVVSLYLSIFNVHLMPIILCGILISAMIDARVAMVTNIGVSVLLFACIAVSLPGGADMRIIDTLPIFMVSILGTALLVFRMYKAVKRIVYVLTLLIVSVIMAVPIFFSAVYLGGGDYPFAAIQLGFFGAGICAQILLSLVMQPMFESIFNLVTNSRLVEIMDLRQPLLRKMQAEAPGTFGHCMQVANLAETCATAIGENPYLARAAALYHDVGKILKPKYFSENQPDNENPHDELMPEVSMGIIVEHTYGGYDLCMANRIPKEIARITVEHHGTLPAALFYNKARQMTDVEVDINDYRYQGATPTSKISAIIMICDACEAAIRSLSKSTGEKVASLVNMLINYRLMNGQFDDCGITMRDLHIIRKTIYASMGGLHHKRISYDETKK